MVTDGLRGHQPLARLHPCQMHPCQLLLLALHSDSTRIIMVLLTHEILALNDPIRKQPNGGCGSNSEILAFHTAVLLCTLKQNSFRSLPSAV